MHQSPADPLVQHVHRVRRKQVEQAVAAVEKEHELTPAQQEEIVDLARRISEQLVPTDLSPEDRSKAIELYTTENPTSYMSER